MVYDLKKLSAIFFLVSLVSCSERTDTSTPPSSKETFVKPAPSARGATLAQLPDFSTLVEQHGMSVVNISTTQKLSQQGFPGFQGMPEDDPFFDFFRRFIPPGPQQPREYRTQSLGSGFIISEDGYVLTNAHVVANADEVTVKLTDKREFKAKVVGADKRTDIALLKITANHLPHIQTGNAMDLKVGEWVVAIGSPFGFENSVTAGIVSAKGRSLPDETYVPFIQTDVAVNPGNSGGPLFNLRGEVIGVNSQIYSRTGGYMGLSFAIPIDVAMNIADQLRNQGKVSRGKLGVQIQELTADLAASFGLKEAKGVLVAGVEPAGPADKAGILPGDVILKFDNKPINSANELPLLVASSKPGTRLDIELLRKGSVKKVVAVIGELGADSTPKAESLAPTSNRLGLVLREFDTEEKQSLGISRGLLVEEVQGLAARSGVRPGDIILAINADPVITMKSFNQALEKNRGKGIALLIRREGNTLYIPIKPE